MASMKGIIQKTEISLGRLFSRKTPHSVEIPILLVSHTAASIRTLHLQPRRCTPEDRPLE